MESLKKYDNVFKGAIVVAFIANIVTCFLPIYTYSRGTTYYMYNLYTAGAFYTGISFTSLIVPIMAIAFLFASFKDSKIFFFGLSATYIINSIFLILYIYDITSRNEYEYEGGYYLYIITLVLLSIATIAFMLYMISKHTTLNVKREELKPNSKQTQSSIDAIKEKIAFLEDLKKQGFLTESEYEQKRANIINELEI